MTTQSERRRAIDMTEVFLYAVANDGYKVKDIREILGEGGRIA